MSIPRLFLGELGGNRLLQADDGFQDAGLAIAVRLESELLAPAGPGGEAIFSALYLVFTATMAATIVVTPIVWSVEDGEVVRTELETQSIVLASEPERRTTHHELGLSVPLLEPVTLIERGRFAPRGTWFAIRLDVAALAAGDLILDGVSVEHEVVRESLQAQALA